MTDKLLHKKYHHEQTGNLPFDSQILRWLLGYLQPYKFLTFIAILFLVIAKSIEAFIPLFIGYETQKVINVEGIDSDAQFNQIFYSSIQIIFLLLIAYLLDTASMLIKNWVGQKAVYTLRTQVYQHIQHLPLSYFDYHPIGRLMTRTIHDIDQISQMMTESVVPIMGSIILFICMCIGLLILDWHVALVFACIMPFVLWLTYYFSVNERYWYDVIRGIVSSMNTYVQEHLMGSSIIRNFGLHEKEKKQFDTVNEDYREANLETIHYFSLFIAGIDLLQGISLIAVFVTLVLFSSTHFVLQVGTFFAFSLYVIMFFRPLSDLAERYNILQSAVAAASRVYSIIQKKSEPMENELETPLAEVVSIEFADVWFAYENENWVLKGVSFEIKKGESVALVGVTGSGKSSIINLLLRTYNFQKGSIKINGIDIRNYSLHALRRAFSTVLQEPVIFSGTLFDNIVLYQNDFPPDKIQNVIDNANLSTFINRFPNGIYHRITERGQTLSMGELQLISLARAVAHERSVLILDEATANIDSFTENIIQNALKKILFQRTALVIAHRLSTIKDVTRIIVLNKGVIVETGSHQELLKKKGLYEKLYRTQFTKDKGL